MVVAAMTEIQVLSDVVANQIAAGEVVERPASVVKELVENALDAGSTRIEVRVSDGGKELVAVRDDGRAMTAEDAELCFERHATSKLVAIDDLRGLGTLGFRGEALPSIASVALVRLVTCRDPLAGATEVRVEGGRTVSVQPTAAPTGTEVEVRELFFNTPARRKHLRATATELGHVTEVVNAAALANADVSFSLEHGGHTLLLTPGSGELEAAAMAVLGKDVARHMVTVDDERDGVRAYGLIVPPDAPAPPARPPFVFVNGRPVRMPLLRRALSEGYRGTLPPGRNVPPGVLFIEVDPAEVDVNVHPSKREVRFVHPSRVSDAVAAVVADALAARAPVFRAAGAGIPLAPSTQQEPLPGTVGADRAARGISRPVARPAARSAPVGTDIGTRPGQVQAVLAKPRETAPSGRTDTPVEDLPQQERFDGRFAGLIYIGELFDTYLLFQGRDELLMVDLHAAAERTKYEELVRSHADGDVGGQELVSPQVLELGPREAVLLQDRLDELAGLGLAIEPFGKNSFQVSRVPVVLGRTTGPDQVRALIDDILRLGKPKHRESQVDAILKIMACRGSIKAGERLTPGQAEDLLRKLLRCEHPWNCPHGRPTIVGLTRTRIEKDFSRIVG
jgi:DNA mismatch repair protein MutL